MGRGIEKLRIVPPERIVDGTGKDMKQTGRIVDDSTVDEIVEGMTEVKDTLEISEQGRKKSNELRSQKEEKE
ncbi:hypothetical protein KKA15_00795 [Patescibacteria group bacterium]|nr:hypothetical protein [Patescibacteria group bacterium]